MKVDLKEGGAEVVLKKLSKSLDKDSVRVDGIGPASVTEVSYQVHQYMCSILHPRLKMVTPRSIYTAHLHSYIDIGGHFKGGDCKYWPRQCIYGLHDNTYAH